MLTSFSIKSGVDVRADLVYTNIVLPAHVGAKKKLV